MTPKEKAQELIEMFIGFASDEDTTEDGFVYSEEIRIWKAKQCALIAVDEILEECLQLKVAYWEEVKEQIETFNTKEK